jgi:hypothetical protein
MGVQVKPISGQWPEPVGSGQLLRGLAQAVLGQHSDAEGCGQLHESGGLIQPPAASFSSLGVSWRSVSVFNTSLRGWNGCNWSIFIDLIDLLQWWFDQPGASRRKRRRTSH